jgi:hypothetical protein
MVPYKIIRGGFWLRNIVPWYDNHDMCSNPSLCRSNIRGLLNYISCCAWGLEGLRIVMTGDKVELAGLTSVSSYVYAE